MIQIHAELELTGCSGELCVNGIPVPGLHERRPTFEVSVPVQHSLVTGKNTLELWVDVEGKPNEYRTKRRQKADGGAVAIGRLVAYPIGVIGAPENGRVLASIEYRGDKDDGEEAPRVLTLSVDVEGSFGPWAWQSAPELVLDEGTLKEAAQVVSELHEALFSGDPQRVLSLIDRKWREMDRAYPGQDDAQDRRNHAAWIVELASDPRRRAPLSPGRHAFRLVAGGRMIECIDDDYAPSIRLRQEVEPDHWAEAMYPVSLARIDGRLVVVR